MRTSLWYVNQAHATNYSVGRVFCGGDAVHRHPPSSGLGSNTSHPGRVQPGLEARVRRQGPRRPGLLDSYTLERAPVGRADRRPGQPVPRGLRRAAGVVRPRQRRPGRRRADQAHGAQPGRRRRPRARCTRRLELKNTSSTPTASSSTSATTPPRSSRTPTPARGVAAAPRGLPAGHHPPRCQAARTPGWSTPTAAGSPPSTSPARGR